jgi:O-methyltransferase
MAMATTGSLEEHDAHEIMAWWPPVDDQPTTPGGMNVEHLLIDRAVRLLYQPNPAGTAFPAGAKAEIHSIAARTIGGGPVTYLEFGVAEGGSMHQISTLFPDPAATFVGFDSFEGLPEAWGPYLAGHFSTDGTTPAIADGRIKFIKGWFQNSVPEFLRTNKLHGPVLVHFDADIYTSTLFLMTTLWHHIPDYYFLFDEFVPSEIVAMYDFARAYPVAFEFFACTVDDRDRPLQLFGRLRNAVFRPTSPGH